MNMFYHKLALQIVSENWVTVEREIIFQNWVTANGWNRHRILIHDRRMKSREKTESSLTHVIIRENYITTNQKSSAKTLSLKTFKWQLKSEWQMTYGSRARPTHQIESKNRFMATAWNCHTHFATADPEIVSENSITVEREIIFENWVTTNGWNRHRILIHDWRMKSREKTEISLTYGIVSENYITTNQKSSTKTLSLKIFKSQLKSEW